MEMKALARALVVAVLALMAATPVRADLLLWNGSTDQDWFDPDNWTQVPGFVPNGHTVPESSDSATVLTATGPDLTAADAAAAGVASLNLQNLYVGADDFADSGGTGPFVGDFTVDGFDFSTAQGHLGSSTAGEGNATGTMTVNDAKLSSSFFRVGLLDQAASGSEAMGTLTLTGVTPGTQFETGTLWVGFLSSDDAGLAKGSVSASGDVAAGQVLVGWATSATIGGPTVGQADGSLTVDGNLSEVDTLRVGNALAAGSQAKGKVEVTGSLSGFEGVFSFGGSIDIGSTVGEDSVGEGSVTADSIGQPVALNPFDYIRVGRAQGANSMATGSLVALNGTDPLMVGNFGGLTVEVGTVRGSPGFGFGGTADGTLRLGQVLEVPAHGINDFTKQIEMDVGVLDGPGMAKGVASLPGLIEFRQIRVGVVQSAGEGGPADGLLEIGSAGLDGDGSPFTILEVGLSRGAAMAKGKVVVQDSDVSGFSSAITVGAADDAAFSGGPAGALIEGVGELELINGSIDSTGIVSFPSRLEIGLAKMDQGQAGTADGKVLVDNSGISDGKVLVSSIAVGSAQSIGSDAAGGDAQAKGSLIVKNSEVEASFLSVGTTFVSFFDSSGRGEGLARFEDSTLRFSNFSPTFGDTSAVRVGTATGGTAHGTLELIDSTLEVGGTYTAGTEFIGSSEQGKTHLTRSLVTVGGDLTFGDGSILQIDAESTARQFGYGAIDVGGTATLAGDLLLEFDPLFDFSAAIGMTLDLIVASAFDISNPLALPGLGFEAIAYGGLPSWILPSAAIVPGDMESAIFQISFQEVSVAVPEPGQLSLFLLGLLGLSLALRGRLRPARA